MADDTTRRIYEVEISAADALKQLAELRLRSAELKEQQKSLGKVTQDNAEEYYKLENQIKALNSKANVYQKEIQTNIKLENQQKESLNALRAKLSLMTAEYSKMGDTENEVARKAMLAKEIAEVSDELKKQENALGDHRRSVGDYEIATKSLRTELRELTRQLQQMALAGDTTSQGFKDLLNRAKELQTTSDQVNKMVSGETKLIEAASSANTLLAIATRTWVLSSVAAKQLGVEESKAADIMQQLSLAMTALLTVQTIANTLNKQSTAYRQVANLAQAFSIKQTLAETAATNGWTGALAANSIMVKAVTVAQKLWNMAMNANPIILMLSAVVGLTGGIIALTKAMQGHSKYTKEANAAMAEYNKTAKEQADILDRLNAKAEAEDAKRAAEAERRLEDMRKEGTTEEEIAEQRYQDTLKQNTADTEAAQARLDSYEKERKALQNAIDLKQKEADTWRGGKKGLKEVNDQLEGYNKRMAELNNLVVQEEANIKNLGTALDKTTREYTEQGTERTQKAAEDAAKAAKDAADKIYEIETAQSKRRQKLLEADLKYRATFFEGDTAEQLKHDAELFEVQQQGERERLELQKKNGKITTEEYKGQLAEMAKESRQFYADQAKALNKYYSDSFSEIDKLLGVSSVEDEIRQIEQEYADAIKKLHAIEIPVKMEGMDEDEYNALLDKYFEYQENVDAIAEQLEEARQKRITEVEMKARKDRLAAVKTAIEQEYDEELALAADNQRKTLELNNEMLQKEIEERRKMGETTYKQEQQLIANNAALRELDLNNELIEADRSAKKRYEARKAYLQAELEAYQGNADKELEIMYELTELERERFEEVGDKLADYASSAMDMLSSFNDFSSQLSDNQKDKVTAQYDAEAEALEDKLNRGVISQEQYDTEMAELEAEQDQKIAEIEREQAKRDKAISIMETVINTATSIMKTSAQLGYPAAIPFVAMAAAQGAMELATIMAEPLPEAAKGRYIKGPSHAGGGVRIEAEGGEAIINKKSTSMFLPLLSAINEAGGGVPFIRPGSDGGYAARSAMAQGGVIETGDLQGTVAEAMESMKIYVTVEDIQRETAKYVKVEQRGSY